MENIIDIKQFLEYKTKYPIIDVRSQSEYLKGHIPGAVNIPVLTDEERHKIGFIYKKNGRDYAILKGLELVGPNLRSIVSRIQKISPEKNIMLHCWRGGMRSSSVSWLLNFCGFNSFVLNGGYKSFRNYALQLFEKPRKILILGGKTGSGKTHLINMLCQFEEQIIDLEKLAFHKGSAFGGYEQPKSLTQEQFENELAFKLMETNENKYLWLEDESRTIGSLSIPNPLWENMRKAKVIFIEVPINIRVENIVSEYGLYEKEKLQTSLQEISKRLGGLNTKIADEYISNNQLDKACEIILQYYDKAYLCGLSRRENSENIYYLSINNNHYYDTAGKIIEIASTVKDKN